MAREKLRVILFGGTGKVGSGIYKNLTKQVNLQVLSPSSDTLNLLESIALKKYLSKHKPNVIIHAAESTVDINSSLIENERIFENNVKSVINLLDASTNVDMLIHTGSASIYQNFPSDSIFEEDFMALSQYSTSSVYAKSKSFGSLAVKKYVDKGHNWYSLILPHVIHANSKTVKYESYFNELSNLIVNQKMNSESFEVLYNLDLKSSRQFIHSEDVGKFCNFIIKECVAPGIIHLPNLPLITFSQLFKELYQMLSLESPFVHGGEQVRIKKIFTKEISTKHFSYDNSEKVIAKRLFEYSKEFSAKYLS